MPQNATELAGADWVVRVSEMAALLVELTRAAPPPEPGGEPAGSYDRTAAVVAKTIEAQARNERNGQLCTFTCPECSGPLWQVDEAKMIQFRCHTGHAYNGEALLAEQSDALEAALWTSIRTFREKSVLGRQLATSERQKGHDAAAARFEEQAEQAARYATLIVDHVLHANGGGPPAQSSAL